MKVRSIHHLGRRRYAVRYWWERGIEARVQFFNDNNDVNGIDLGITLHDHNGVEGIYMDITVNVSNAIENYGVDSFDMGITMNGKYTTTGKKSGGFEMVISVPIKNE